MRRAWRVTRDFRLRAWPASDHFPAHRRPLVCVPLVAVVECPPLAPRREPAELPADVKPPACGIAALRPPRPPLSHTEFGKSCACTCKHMTIRRGTVHGAPLFLAPRRGEFEQVPAPDTRRTPARHNSIGALKMPIFPGKQTPGCQLSQLARWGVEAQKTPELPSSYPSAPFRVLARCGGCAA